MTRGVLIIVVFFIIASFITGLMIASDGFTTSISVYKHALEFQNKEMELLAQKLELERIKNAEKDSILVVYKENMKVHSMGLQDANWRLIQLKRLIEDGQKE